MLRSRLAEAGITTAVVLLAAGMSVRATVNRQRTVLHGTPERTSGRWRARHGNAPAEGTNLLENGDFSRQLERWERFHDGTVSDRDWSAKVVYDEDLGSDVFEWRTEAGGRDGNTTGARQRLDLDPSEYRELVLEADLKVISHSLRGGGKGLCGEYPVELVLQYENRAGERKAARASFYCVGPPPSEHKPQFHLEQVSAGTWHHFRSENLIRALADATRLNFVQLSGSGWDYEGRVDNVALWGTPERFGDSAGATRAAPMLDRLARLFAFGRANAAAAPRKQYAIFAPGHDGNAVAALERLLGQRGDSVTCRRVNTLREGLDAQPDLLVIMADERDAAGLTPFNAQALRAQRTLGVGLGAATVFGAAGLAISAGHCAHGAPDLPRLRVQDSLLTRDGDAGEVLDLFSPPVLDREDFPNDIVFGVYVGGKRPEIRDAVEAIAFYANMGTHAPIARQGNCVLIGVNSHVEQWSPSFGQLVGHLASALVDTPTEALARRVAATPSQEATGNRAAFAPTREATPIPPPGPLKKRTNPADGVGGIDLP